MNIEHLMTPYKYRKPVLSGSGIPGRFDQCAVDVPTVFRHNGRFYMLYVGFDGMGYQTALAVSDDLIHWTSRGIILPRGSSRGWDSVGMAGTAPLMETDLFHGSTLKKYQGKYWMLYHAYPDPGYEIGSAEIGLCWTEDEELMDWHFAEQPIFSWRDGAAWERGGLYKCCLVEHGGRFFMFYNAKNRDTWPWIEQIGMAESNDLFRWHRKSNHPVLVVTPHAWDEVFVSDPQVFYDSIGKQWVMFYYGLGNLSACDGIAVSQDLCHWQKYPIPILTIGSKGTIDEKYAHKPGLICANGVLYHFYCACRPIQDDDACRNGCEFRCISVARSIPWEVT